jgi:hypothetical protein
VPQVRDLIQQDLQDHLADFSGSSSHIFLEFLSLYVKSPPSTQKLGRFRPVCHRTKQLVRLEPPSLRPSGGVAD